MSGLAKASGFPTEPSVLTLSELSSPLVYDDVANIGDIAGPGSSYTVQDVSAHGTRARRKVTTLLDSGTVTFPLWFIAAETTNPESTHTDNTNGLEAIHKRGDLRAYAIFLRDDDGTAYYFNAFISKFSMKEPVAGVHSADVELTIDGEYLKGTEAGGRAAAVFAPTE